jgi:tetratricopeptide (TPR) repeat protein
MKPRKNIDSAQTALTFRNILWALPYLAVIGLFLGYMSWGPLGAFVGLLVAIAISATVASATTVFAGILGGGAVDVFYGLGRKIVGLREQLTGDLNIAKHHKACDRFDEALIKIEDVLAKDPDYSEALFLKARILWEGFGDREAAKTCLLKIIKVETDKDALYHRWALDFYRELSKS